MKHSKCYLQLILGCLLSCLVAGCFSSKYVEHKQYLLDIPEASAKKTSALARCSVFVDHVDAVAPFDKLDFLYRVTRDRYLVDYYNGFLVLPSEQLETILGAYLTTYGGFSLDVTGLAKNRLRVKLIELYADYRNRNNPQAVVSVQFILTKYVGGKNIVLVDKVFRRSTPLKVKTTNSLLRGWNEGLKDLLIQGVQELKRKVSC